MLTRSELTNSKDIPAFWTCELQPHTVTAEGHAHAHDPGIAIMRMHKKRYIFWSGFIVPTFLAVN